jgi:CheY-like chemotaxis protein
MAAETLRRRVLVADDDPSIRQLLSTIVRREHFEVDSVGDGAQAIEKLQRRQYSVILLDLMMPRVDGFDVIDYLKENPPVAKPMVLVITAYGDQKSKKIDKSVVSEVIPKPFEIADLAASLRNNRFVN